MASHAPTVADPAARAAWQVPEFRAWIWRSRLTAYCLVIPVINEGERIKSLLSRMAALDLFDRVDVVIVDGGSTDGSLDSATLAGMGLRGLLTKIGPGRLSAQLRCGYAFALDEGYEGIVTIDGNDKDDPKDIPAFIDALGQGYDFVQASRFIAGGIGENTPALRSLAIRWIHAPALSACSGFHWTDTTQGFRGYSRAMLLDPRVAPFRDVFQDYELLAYLSYRAPQLGYRCIELPAVRRYPPGEVPTKIGGFSGNLSLLRTLVRVCSGALNPPG